MDVGLSLLKPTSVAKHPCFNIYTSKLSPAWPLGRFPIFLWTLPTLHKPSCHLFVSIAVCFVSQVFFFFLSKCEVLLFLTNLYYIRIRATISNPKTLVISAQLFTKPEGHPVTFCSAVSHTFCQYSHQLCDLGRAERLHPCSPYTETPMHKR